jgi:GNAT superfamily N-acetyltransferase
MADLTIRAAGRADLVSIRELYRHLHPDEPVLPDGEAEAAWHRLIGHPGLTVYLGLQSGGQPVASCTLVVIPNLTRSAAPYALIENVVTHGDHRQRGYGRAVLHAAVAAAWEAGCYKVMLMTGSRNPATHAFYRNAGFEQSKTGYQIRRPEA